MAYRRIITSYLGGQTNALKIRQSTSARRTTQHGVLQGLVLGSMLFNLYCLPIADTFKRHNLQYHMYTDDTQLYADCPQHRDVLLHIDEERQWLTKNKLMLDKNKTEAITFWSSSAWSPTVGSVISVVSLSSVAC